MIAVSNDDDYVIIMALPSHTFGEQTIQQGRFTKCPGLHGETFSLEEAGGKGLER